MPFSAATCLTFNPSIQPSTGPFDIYLDSDYSSTPIVTNVSLWDLSNNCPYIIQNIPNGTTNLGIKDIANDYCITIPIQNNDICSECNLGFSNYSSTTISKLYCGNLTGSCQTITDYKINWYGPNNTTTLAFTSGKGNIFSYTYTHPFSTVSSSIPVASGVYTPVIESIVLSGLTFSNIGGVGAILFSGNCLPTTNVLPLTCNYKTNTSTDWRFSAYTNYLSFDSNTGASPQPQTNTYQISANTKYIVWAFKGESNPDRITLSFSGVSYPILIGLDDFIIGSDLNGNNFNPSSYPKSADTSDFFIKYTCLTGLTVNNNDNIIIDITPATSNTRWELYMSCLDDYECNDCIRTSDMKIIGSSITGITGNCDVNTIKFNISGCSYPDNTSEYMNYYLGNNYSIVANYYSYFSSLNNNIVQNSPLTTTFFTNITCFVNGISINSSCQTDSNRTIYDKTFSNGKGVFGFTGSSTFISTYYESIKNAFSGLTPYNSVWTGSTNSSDMSYYRYYILKIPSQTTPLTCNDGNTFTSIYLHHTSTYITGTTGSEYYLKLTANTISNNISFTNCQLNCNGNQQSIVSTINVYSTGTTSSYGVNREFSNGMYYTNPLNICYYLNSGNTSVSATTYSSYYPTPDWSFNTYPFSGTPATIIPSLSGSVCNYNSTGVNYINTYNSFYNLQYKYYYQVRLTNPLNVKDFDIWASPITNFSYSGAPFTAQYELAYRYSGGSVTYSNPTYII